MRQHGRATLYHSLLFQHYLLFKLTSISSKAILCVCGEGAGSKEYKVKKRKKRGKMKTKVKEKGIKNKIIKAYGSLN